jgi:uncharacterized surface protein with fasciclin (FAS1) repeats
MKRFRWVSGTGAVAIAAVLAVAAVASPASAGKDDHNRTKKQTVVTIAAKNGDFTTLTTAIKRAGLVKTLKGKGPFTVFAPTDEAFAKLPTGQLDALLADKDALTNVLTYHVLGSKVLSSALQPTQEVAALNAMPFTITVADGKATITDGQGNEVNIVETDIRAKNGVIHVIDSVMLPPSSS